MSRSSPDFNDADIVNYCHKLIPILCEIEHIINAILSTNIIFKTDGGVQSEKSAFRSVIYSLYCVICTCIILNVIILCTRQAARRHDYHASRRLQRLDG